MNQKRSEIKRIVLTGGHAATTALAVTEELIRRSGQKYIWDIFWIGTKRALEGKKVLSIESVILPRAGVKFHPIITGRIQRKFTLWTIPSLLQIPFGFIHALFIIKKIKPHIILSFGGFASFPTVVIGWLLKIPIIMHEQTSVYGRANKLASIFSNKILLARESSLRFYPKEKSEVIGNPILTQIANILPKSKMDIPPTIYITGGSRGSVSLNSFFKEILNKLLSEYYVVHQTGYSDYKRFQKIRGSLSRNLKKRYELYPNIDPMQVDGVFKRADIVVSRAGANTVSDIIAARRPAIFIPLPFAYKNEQYENAIFAQNFGVAKVLSQNDLNSQKLYFEIQNLMKNWNKMVGKIKNKISPDVKASQKLVDILEKQIE